MPACRPSPRPLFLLAVLALGQVACADLSSMLTRYGFTELTPPSTLFAPGTMVWVKNATPFTAGVICTQRASLGSDFEPLLAPTASSQINRATSGEFEMGAESLTGIRADGRFKAVSRIGVSLSNASVLTLSDADILYALPNRDPLCSRAVAVRQRAGYTVTMIASALKADVLYRVGFDGSASLDVDSKQQVLKSLAPHLGIDNASSVSDDSITGNGLFWGIIDDSYLASLSADMPLMPAPPPPDGPLRVVGAEHSLQREAVVPDVY